MLSALADYYERKAGSVPREAASNDFLQLLVHVAQSPSLMVSIPVLASWTRMLTHGALGRSEMLSSVVGPLLELCSSRLIRYESLPDDSNDPTFLFLLEDTDTMPERHAFLGNYRRYSAIVIENIVQLRLHEAMSHILRSTEEVLVQLQAGQQPIDSAILASQKT